MPERRRQSIRVWEPRPEAAALLICGLAGAGYDPLPPADAPADLCLLAPHPYADSSTGLRAAAGDAALIWLDAGAVEPEHRADVVLRYPISMAGLLAAIERSIGPPPEPDPALLALRLDRFSMARLLAEAAGLELSGRLALRVPGWTKHIWFERGRVRAAASDLTIDRLGNILLSRGLLGEAALMTAVRQAERTREPIGAVLVQRGLLDQAGLVRELNAQCVTVVNSLFNPGAIELSCVLGAAPERSVADLAVPALIVEGLLTLELRRLQRELPEVERLLLPGPRPAFPMRALGLDQRQTALCARIEQGVSLIELLVASDDSHTTKALVAALLAGRLAWPKPIEQQA